MTKPNTTQPDTGRAPAHAFLPKLVAALVFLVLVLMPLRILDFGFLPPDDALRHAAKAVSGKAWSEILVMRPGITIDHNPGWHWILAALHRVMGWDTRTLVQVSVLVTFWCFALSPVRWIGLPEAWLASFTLVLLIFPYFAERVFVGRPLLITMGATLVLLSLWTDPKRSKATLLLMLGSAALMAISAWIHGSWYLLVLIPAVFFLAQEWRKGMELTLCWIMGSVIGALWTGQPWTFLKQSAMIPYMALGQHAPLNSLVGEFQPFSGSYPALILIAAVMVVRKLAGRPMERFWRDPVFWMALIGLLLGFRVLRFWLDWGIPALALWFARQIQELEAIRIDIQSQHRLVFSCVIALVLVLTVGSNRAGRWSQYGAFEALDVQRPDQAEWLPAAGGILYCVDLSVFYQTFFQNPHGNWRYILGFEPSFMRPEDLAVYQDLWRTLNAVQACAPWVKQMTPADRLVLRGGPRTRLSIPGLQWAYAATNTWVGRLPRAGLP
jgi:hypothetical protein